MPRDVILVGAGGHAMVLAEIMIGLPDTNLAGFIDKDTDKPLPDFVGRAGARVIGGDEVMESRRDTAHFHLAIGAQHAEVRLRLMAAFGRLGLKQQSIVHPTAAIAPSAVLGESVAVMAKAAVQTGARIGDFSCVNTGTVVDHDCRLGRNVFVQPGASLGGGVEVGDDTVIGIGASVRDGIRIGRNCVIGGGAFVAKDIPDNSLAMGVPAKVVGDRDPITQSAAPVRPKAPATP